MEVPQTIKQENVDYYATESDVNFETNIVDSMEIKPEFIKIEPHSHLSEPNNLVQTFNLMKETKINGNNDECMFSCSLNEISMPKDSKIKLEESDEIENMEDIVDVKWETENIKLNSKDGINIEDGEQGKESKLVCQQQQRETPAANCSNKKITSDNLKPHLERPKKSSTVINCHHGTYCAVDDCFISTKDGLSLFSCPKDPVRCQEWKESLGFIGNHRYAKLTAKEAHSRIKICCLHFEENCFTVSGKRLIKTAIPTTAARKLSDFKKSCDVSIQTDQPPYVNNFSQTDDVQPYSSCQTPRHLSATSPEEEALKRRIEELENDLRASKKCRLEVCQELIFKFLDDNYPANSTILIKNQLQLLDKEPKRARYSNEM